MRQVKLKIQINRSASTVFEFCMNPKNTPKWVDSIIEEKTNEQPVKLGSVYKNTSDGKKWNEYTLTEFEKDKMFTMTAKDGNYKVKYTITPLNDNSCELEYYEWTKKGDLETPFTIKPLQKLKKLTEN